MKIISKISLVGIVLIVSVFFFGTSQAAAQQKSYNSDFILGKWTSQNGDRTIEFVKKEDKYSAVISASAEKSLIGKEQIKSLRWTGSSYAEGKLIMVRKGRELDCQVAIKDDNTIEISGKVGFISRTQIWKRVK